MTSSSDSPDQARFPESGPPEMMAAGAAPAHGDEVPTPREEAPARPGTGGNPDVAGEGAREPLEPRPEDVEGATPPGYDWPTHGGYLGCLVGALAACPIVGFIGANIWALFHLSRLAFPLFVLLALASLAAVVGAARLGWVLGRRFYRYYPQPRPTWGESDLAEDPRDARPAENPAGAEAPMPNETPRSGKS